MAGGKLDHPKKSRILRPFRLSDSKKRDLVDFLNSLTDEACSTILAGATRGPQWAANPYPALLRLT
jgi:hypothetical protein